MSDESMSVWLKIQNDTFVSNKFMSMKWIFAICVIK